MDFLVVGLGNPGKEYELTRHNIGFLVLDSLANQTGVEINRTGFKGFYNDVIFSDKKLMLFKPQTFMNLSGNAVKEIKNFYKIENQKIIVVHDEIDIELGTLKIKEGGGSAGHNGIKSIIENLNDNSFKRIRVGIGKPGNQNLVSSHVLSKFSSDEKKIVKQLIENTVDAIKEIIKNGIENAMNKYNKKTSATKEEKSNG